MREINKGAEPPSLTLHRHTPGADYDNYSDKDALRQALVTEQRGLCCYCMGRIRSNAHDSKIEHWRCQSRYPAEQISYRNLLAACRGGEGSPSRMQHCDTFKGDRDLLWNPADPAHHIETRLRYGVSGEIKSDDADFHEQLNTVLHLNLPFLVNNRKAVLDAVVGWWRKERNQARGPVPKALLVRERNGLIGGTGVLQPYCQVAVWFLNKKLASMAP